MACNKLQRSYALCHHVCFMLKESLQLGEQRKHRKPLQYVLQFKNHSNKLFLKNYIIYHLLLNLYVFLQNHRCKVRSVLDKNQG